MYSTYIGDDVGPEIFERLRLAMQCDDGMYCGDSSAELGTRLGNGCVQCRYLVWS